MSIFGYYPDLDHDIMNHLNIIEDRELMYVNKYYNDLFCNNKYFVSWKKVYFFLPGVRKNVEMSMEVFPEVPISDYIKKMFVCSCHVDIFFASYIILKYEHIELILQMFICTIINHNIKFAEWSFNLLKNRQCENEFRKYTRLMRDKNFFKKMCEFGNLEFVEWAIKLIFSGLMINETASSQFELLNALQIHGLFLNEFKNACKNGHLEIAKIFFKNIGHISEYIGNTTKFDLVKNIALNQDKEFIFGQVCINGHMRVVEWLIKLLHENKFIIDIHYHQEHIFRHVCSKGDFEMMKLLMDLSQTMNYEMINYRAKNDFAFRHLCANGHLEQAKWLLKFSIEQKNVVDVNSLKDYAFRHACKGHLEVVEWLINLSQTLDFVKDIDIHAKQEYAFRKSCKHNHIYIIKWLMKYSYEKNQLIDIHAKREYAFRYVCKNGYLMILNFLMTLSNYSKININAISDYAFRHACKGGHLEIVEKLIELSMETGQKINIGAKLDYAFRFACANNHIKIVEYLIKQSWINVNAKNDFAFRYACRNGHLEMASYLENFSKKMQGQPINIHAKKEYAFRYACRNGHLEIAKMLVKIAETKGKLINIHAKNDYAFRKVVSEGHLHVCTWLVELSNTPGYKLIDIMRHSLSHADRDIFVWLMEFVTNTIHQVQDARL